MAFVGIILGMGHNPMLGHMWECPVLICMNVFLHILSVALTDMAYSSDKGLLGQLAEARTPVFWGGLVEVNIPLLAGSMPIFKFV